MVKYLILLLSFTIFGCSNKKEDPKVETKSGIELIAIGSINFGNVLLGEYREATLRVTNYGPDTITNFSPVLNLPFSINKVSAPCNTGTINVGVSCNIVVRFAPVAKGLFKGSLTVGTKSQDTSGQGVDSSALIDYSVTSFDLGSVIAGNPIFKDILLTNNGDFAVHTPVPTLINGYSVSFNECGNFISPKKTCKITFRIVKETVGSQSEQIVFISPDVVTNFELSVNSQVLPGPPAGTILLSNPPTSIIANGGLDSKTITTFPIRDQFGNIVSDGTEVSMIGSNVTLQGPATKSTVGGIVSYSIVSTTQTGDATVTLLSEGATGFSRFRSLAGPAVGEVVAKPYLTSVEANGLSQIDISFNPLRDQFNNVIEDGTPVSFKLSQPGTTCLNESPSTPSGIGSLLTIVENSILGSVKATIIAPTQSGSSVLIVKSGTACGAYSISFTPGLAAGIIPIVSSEQGIFANPSTGLAAIPPEIIQSTITIGPVKDQFNNIITSNSSINISLNNAIGVITGISNFQVLTNSQGYASFVIQGIGQRGYINISATKETANGFNRIWAYDQAIIRPDSQNQLSNNVKLYMTYHTSLSNPVVDNSSWGLIKNWNNLDIQDKNYFGDIKKQAPPTIVDNQFPYLVSFCLFSAGNTTYGANCFKDSFNDSSIYQNTIKVTKGNKPLDPGASLSNLFLNFPRGTQIHRENHIGCYKQDTQVGSLTYGEMIFYGSASQSVCNGLTSNDPQSPVYNNFLSPWFGGAWSTASFFDLKYSTVGFIPDLAKTLVFGGFYENFVNGNFLVPNNKQVFMSNRNTWSSNYGIDSPYNWLESDNTNNIYGSFPEKSVMPTMTYSNKDLYMFGGLKLKGNSYTLSGPNLNYIESTVSNDLNVFDGVLNKWLDLSISTDPLITAQNEYSSPIGRYQHGMVYIKDNDSLFISSGKTVDQSLGLTWFETNDMWSVKNISSRNNLQWERRCFPCNFPNNAHNHPVNLVPDDISPTPLKMTYNPFLQKVFMLWSGTNYNIFNFNPLDSNSLINVDTNNNYSFSSLQGQDLFDMEVNQDIGRTYFYKRKDINQFNSELYYWDMDPGMKQYLKVEINLGSAQVKDFIRSLTVNVRGYGSVKDDSLNIQGSGIKVMIYNYNTNLWENVGENSAKNDSEDTPGQKIETSFTRNQSLNFIDTSGIINLMIYPKDSSNFQGNGYNELKIDEVYINGLF